MTQKFSKIPCTHESFFRQKAPPNGQAKIDFPLVSNLGDFKGHLSHDSGHTTKFLGKRNLCY
jgi:hypothetical protein